MSRAVSCGGARGSRALNTRSADRDPIDPIAYTHTQGNQEVNQRGESREAGKGSISQASPVQFFLELAREMERDGDGEDPLADFLTRLVRVILLGPDWRIL